MKALLFALLLWCGAFLHGAEPVWHTYGPSVTLTGTITQEGYGDDPPSQRYAGYQAWILHLDAPISVHGVPGDLIETEERGVTEVHLHISHEDFPAVPGQIGKVRFQATGELHHSITTHHLRPVVLFGTDLRAVEK